MAFERAYDKDGNLVEEIEITPTERIRKDGDLNEVSRETRTQFDIDAENLSTEQKRAANLIRNWRPGTNTLDQLVVALQYLLGLEE